MNKRTSQRLQISNKQGGIDISYESNYGTLDPSIPDQVPRIAVNPYEGGYQSSRLVKMWVDALDVSVALMDNSYDPGTTNNKWDMDEDGYTFIPHPITGQVIRDPGDLMPTIIFKKVSPW